MPRANNRPDKPVNRPKSHRYSEDDWEQFFAQMVRLGGNMSRACEILKINRAAVYDRRKADPTFEARYQQALEQGADALEDEAMRRAMEGVDEPVGFYKGVATTVKRNYSDALIQFLLRAKRPDKYKDRTVNENFNLNLDLASRLDAARKRKKEGK